MKIGILTDYPVVTFACGPSLSTQALKIYLEGRGHEVTIVGPKPGPNDPPALPGSLLLDSLDFKAHPGVRMALAWPPKAFTQHPGLDVIHSHANSLLMHWGPMMRELHNIPCISTNTIYLPAFAQHLLPNKLYEYEHVRNAWSGLSDKVERSFAAVYNGGDGLIVQCQGLADYWNQKGLEVPLHVIPRPIDVRIFDKPEGADPFRSDFAKGGRIIAVCRHAREKDLDKLIEAFARYVAPHIPSASLTLVGDGLEHAALRRLAHTLGVGDRVAFPGEKPQRETPDWYRHADLFAYASLSETYGQVISEALWCGAPVVAVDDKMGVAFQVRHGEDGLLVAPGDHLLEQLGDGIVELLSNPAKRKEFGERAAKRARERVAPEVVYAAYEQAYDAAIAHLAAHPRKREAHNNLPSAWEMTHQHLVPWMWKHLALCGLSAFRGAKGYDLPKVRIDGMKAAAYGTRADE